LAKALLHEPGLLILDEPSTGLDPGVRVEFAESLRRLQTGGTTVVLTTHLLDEAERCDRLVVLDRGRVVTADTPARLRGAVGGDVITVRFADATVAARHEARWAGRFEAARVSRDGATIRAELPGAGSRMGEIIGMIGADAVSVTLSRPTLEDAFLDLTGRRFDR
jgi:ABC-2 type transport system ATP-binding protein